MNEINVCVAGITGWVGQDIARAVRASTDLRLGSGVARSAAGQDAGTVLGDEPWSVPVFGSVADAMDSEGDDVDVVVDYTSHTAVRENVLVAVDRGVHVVVGSSGLTGEDYRMIEARAHENQVSVVAAGNFSISAALAKAAAVLAVSHMPQWEIVDYAYAEKPDAPSGTARELAEAMTEALSQPSNATPAGDNAARGVSVGATRVHSIRLPSYSVSTEIVFGLPDERLTIRHDAGQSATPYVAGTLLAIRETSHRVGLIRGLDQLLGVTG